MLEREKRKPKEMKEEKELWVEIGKGGSFIGSRVMEVPSCSDLIAGRS